MEPKKFTSKELKALKSKSAYIAIQAGKAITTGASNTAFTVKGKTSGGEAGLELIG